MKRTEKKLKSKGIKTYKPKARYYLCYKYDRAFVANHLGDATFVPFSRTSMEGDRWERDDHTNHRLHHYLKKFFRKHVGKVVDEVLHDFSRLGWKHSYEMHYYWEWYVGPDYPRICYSIDGNRCLVSPKLEYRSSPPNENADVEDDEQEKPKTKRPRASEKRLTRTQLDHNESIIKANIEDGGYCDANPGLIGEMFVEIDHKVVKRDVYLIKSPHNPFKHTPISLLGLYKEERRFYYHSVKNRIETVFNEKEQILEATLIRDNSESGELIPCI